uniref:Uncharacterized protein n=1 Tax=Triticum urartu TaxID=4572 RepID=A0A8R7PKG6_TRIUA
MHATVSYSYTSSRVNMRAQITSSLHARTGAAITNQSSHL